MPRGRVGAWDVSELSELSERLVVAHPDPLFVLDVEGRFVTCNPAFERLVGHDLDALLELDYVPFVDERDAAMVDEHFRAAAAGEVRDYEARGTDREGRAFVVDVTNAPVRDTDGTVVAVLGIARDVADRVATRAALEFSERLFRGVFEGSGAGVAITDLQGRFVDANPAYLEMLGYSLDELRTRDFLSLTHPDDRDGNRERVADLLAGRVRSFVLEKRYLTRDDSTVWVRAQVSLVRDGAGDPLHIMATTEDVTAMRAAQEELRRSEALRRLAGGLALVGGWAVEADGTLHWSEEIYRILEAPEGYEPELEEAISIYPDGHRQRLEEVLSACLSDGTPFDIELEVDTYAGRRIPVRAIGEAQRDQDGGITRVFGAFQDISALRAATTAAQDAAERLENTLESMTDAVYTLDRRWRFSYVNSRAEQLVRRPREELLGRVLWDEFPDAVESPVWDAYHRVMEGGGAEHLEPFHYPALEAWFSVSAYPSPDGVTVYFRDVTAQQEALEGLRAREAALRRQAHLLDAAQDAILVRDLEGRITYWNDGAARLYGWDGDAVVGQQVRSLLHDDPADHDRALTAVVEHGRWSGELRHRTRAGDEVVVACRLTLVHDDDGNPEAVLAINTDVTEQRRVEQQLLRAQRMESLGTLAGGIAHDLNNVLSPILLAVDLLLEGEERPEAAALLRTVASSAGRGADLVSQVLLFARGVEGQQVPVEVVGLVADLGVVLRDTFPKHVTTTVEVPDALPPVVGDSTQLQQVLLNLAVNARDAMPDGGNLRITARHVRLDEQQAATTPGAEPGEYVLVEVEDDGIGMPPEVRERVFEPFFTTKAHGAGTGLGLSTAAAIVRSHRGLLQVYSEPGSGTRFRLYLPAEGDPTAVSGTGHRAPTDLPRGDGQLVLVVDDEEAVLSMTATTLERHGYRVLRATNGAEAVSVFAGRADEVDLVLTDMMMPIMDGVATVHALRSIAPDVRVVCASGLHGNGRFSQAGAAGVDRFLPKPYSTRELLEVVAAALADG